MKIAIASGKGGTGKTTIAANLFFLLSKKIDKEIALIDCDVEEPNTHLFFNNLSKISSTQVTHIVPQIDESKCKYCKKCSEYCEFNAITVIPPAKFIQVSEELCHACGACFFACNHDAIQKKQFEIGTITTYKTDFDKKLIEGRLKTGLPQQTPVIRELKKTIREDIDIILYDAPPGTSCSVVSTIENCDLVILVAEPTPFGFNDFKLMLELVKNMNLPYMVVINKSLENYKPIDDFLNKNNIPKAAEIPFKEKFAQMYANGTLLATDKEYAKYYDAIINKINELI